MFIIYKELLSIYLEIVTPGKNLLTREDLRVVVVLDEAL